MFVIGVDKTILYFEKIFHRTGIWSSDNESNFRKIGKKFVLIVLGALFPSFFALNSFLCYDRNESIYSVLTSIESGMEFVRLLYLLFKKEEIIEFVNDQIGPIENRAEYVQMNKKINKLMRFARPYCIMVYITAALLVSIKLPVFSDDKGLPFFISFTWNDSEIIYWLTYLFIAMVTPFYATVNLSTPLLWYILLIYAIKYELLGNKLKNLGSTIEPRSKKNHGNFRLTRQSTYVADLIVVIKKHRVLAEYMSAETYCRFQIYLLSLPTNNRTVERFRSCFSALFFGQIITSGISICTSIYSLSFTTKENIVQTELYAVMLMHGILDIFMVTYLANDITLASNRLSYCLYESNWIDQNESCKKYVLIMGEVLQQPQELLVSIYLMNLETFTRIINGAYSMFNILTNLAK